MKSIKGLIPGVQRLTNVAKPHWQYGIVNNDKKIIDPLLHYGCFTLGFDRHDILDYVYDNIRVKPEIAESIVKNEDLYLNEPSYRLSDTLFHMTGYKSIFALSGSDANEGAVKLASAYQKIIGQTQRTKIVCFENSYHGSTFLNYNMGDSLFTDPFYTMKPYDQVIRLSRDFDITQTDWNQVMCVMLETCSYGQQLRPNTEDFWNKIKQLQEQGVVVIVDDIFIGGGKTGSFVGWRNTPIQPDIFTMGKAITGGFFPLSVTMYNKKIDDVLPNDFDWEHGFTYNYSLPGVLSCLKYIDILHQEQLMSQHHNIVTSAKTIFEQAGYHIVGQFGTLFDVQRGDDHKFFIIPINATEEYFAVLKGQVQ
jgi:adenosylmethionine-8-amino-7-oxononanoate aminotransferase